MALVGIHNHWGTFDFSIFLKVKAPDVKFLLEQNHSKFYLYHTKASVFRGKVESVLDLSSHFADPFDFTVAITLALPVMPNWQHKWLPPLTLPTPTMETTCGAFIMSGMRWSTAILRPPGKMGNWSLHWMPPKPPSLPWRQKWTWPGHNWQSQTLGSPVRSSTSWFPFMLPSCRSSNGFLHSFVFSFHDTTGSPLVGSEWCL